MGICAKLSHIRRKGRRASEMYTSRQLAPTTRQPKLNAPHQSPRPLRGQPVEASHEDEARRRQFADLAVDFTPVDVEAFIEPVARRRIECFAPVQNAAIVEDDAGRR